MVCRTRTHVAAELQHQQQSEAKACTCASLTFVLAARYTFPLLVQARAQTGHTWVQAAASHSSAPADTTTDTSAADSSSPEDQGSEGDTTAPVQQDVTSATDRFFDPETGLLRLQIVRDAEAGSLLEEAVGGDERSLLRLPYPLYPT